MRAIFHIAAEHDFAAMIKFFLNVLAEELVFLSIFMLLTKPD